jgi:hypothetical protein
MRAHSKSAPAVYHLALVCFLWAGGLSSSFGTPTNIFSTQFEFSQGYNPNLSLAGQNGWTKFGSGGNGLTNGFFGGQGQQAYVGYFPPVTGYSNLFVWHPIDFSPVAAGLPLVQFTTLMSIVGSTNGESDYFQWQVLNNHTQPLIVIDFDVYATNVGYFLDGTQYVDTGVKFGLGATYTLTITMNFASNLWSATLNSALLATNQPITTTGKQLTLGEVDAVWLLYAANAPGDNFMLFDNYTITAEAFTPPRPRLTLLGRTSAGQTLLRLNGQNGSKFAIEASINLLNWIALKTNLVTDGSFDYVDSGTPPFSRKLYRARWVP